MGLLFWMSISLLVLPTLAFSFLAARLLGKSWIEACGTGNGTRAIAWFVGGTSAIGFTWAYFIPTAAFLWSVGWMNETFAHYLPALNTLACAITAVGFLCAFALRVWAHRRWRNMLANDTPSWWRVFAQGYVDYKNWGGVKNTQHAWHTLIALAALTFFVNPGGVLTTVVIVRAIARKHALATISAFDRENDHARPRAHHRA